jgi:uncharacterized membrane protein
MAGKGVTMMDWNSSRSEGTEPAAGETSHAPVDALDDARMEIVMGRLLQVGVLLAASVVLAGGLMYVIAHAGESANYRVFTARPLELRHPAALLRGIGRGDASAIVDLGILLLVATPICRVIFAVIAFAIERDRLYVAISLTVLAVLLFGMLRAG